MAACGAFMVINLLKEVLNRTADHDVEFNAKTPRRKERQEAVNAQTPRGVSSLACLACLAIFA